MPPWLTALSWASLAAAFLCTLAITLDILAGRRQHVGIMNVVWPVTALYSGPLGLLAYFAVGRAPAGEHGHAQHGHDSEHSGNHKPLGEQAGLAATHCGAGCTLGDLCAEWLLVAVPLVLFGHKLFGAWVVDFLFAYAFGIAFQYFTIAPMRHLSVGQGLWAAIKADTLSLTAWQMGMYGWMAAATFGIFHRELDQADPVFWFMMQLAMLCGFLTSYPVNAWLLRAGLKEST
jgi:hypothetical protein